MKMTEMIDRGKWFLFFAVVFMVGVVQAATYYVKPDGNDSANGTSWVTALKTPQTGFNKVHNKDTVWMTSSVIVPLTSKRVKVLDLAGYSRFSGAHVDIGCYELYIPKGISISVR